MKIDKNVPPPVKGTHSKYAAILHQMEIGDSILLDSLEQANGFRQTARNHKVLVTARKQADGTIRVWRIGPDGIKPRKNSRSITK